MAVIAAFALGICFGVLQIFDDLGHERQRTDLKFSQILRTVEDSAVQSAFGLDPVLAKKVVNGLLQYRAIFRAEIIDNFGDSMATSVRAKTEDGLTRVAEMLFGKAQSYALVLRTPETHSSAGKITISIDTSIIAETFFSRSGLILLFGVLHSLLLAVVLIVVFHYNLARPLKMVTGEIRLGRDDISIPPGHENDELGDLIITYGDLSRQRTHAEKALRDSESRYELAIAGMSDGIWERNLLTEETYHSSRWFEILGYEPDEFSPSFETFKQSLHPEDEGPCLAALQAHLERGVPFNIEYRIRHKSGDYVWLRAKGQAAWDEDGRPVKMAGSICDISQRKHAEDALRKNESRLRAVIEHAPLIFNLKNLDGEFTMVNSRYADAIGLSVEDTIGKTSHETVSKHFADEIVALDQEVISTGEVKRIELARKEKDGTNIFRENIKFPVMGPDGDVIAVGGVGINITERKRTEEALHKNEARFRILADAASDWFWETDENFILTWFSFDNHPITNTPASKLIGHRPWMWSGVELKDIPAWNQQLETLIKDRQPFRNFVTRIKFPGFGTYDINVSGVPKFDENGTFTGYYGASADITRQVTTEGQLRQAQKLEAVGQLTGGVAHDFNNLLAATMNNAQLLELKAKGRDDLQTLARSIIAASRSGAELTHRLLAFSRNQTLQPKPVQLGALCEGMSELLKRSLGETIEIILTADDETWDVLADPVQVESALLNLAINASHAMPNGGKLAIRVENTLVANEEWAQRWQGRSGEFVALKVTDTGTGMPADVLEHVFEPFFTTKEVGQGSGLGLSMVYGFAQQSDGFVSINSAEGQGATVTIYLPRTDSDGVVREASPVETEIQEGRGETILLIEDDASVRVSTTELLKILGYTVLAAEDGPGALEFLSRIEAVDLLLSDMTLPGGMTGVDIYKKFRQQRPDLKCLFMSGYTSLPDQQLPEATELMSKPIAMEELAGKLRQILDA